MSHPAIFTSNVHCVHQCVAAFHWSRHWSVVLPAWVRAGLRNQAGNASDQCRAQWNTATVCSTQWRHTLGVMGPLVIVLLQIFFWFWQWDNFENRLIFVKVKAYETMVPIFGPTCILILPFSALSWQKMWPNLASSRLHKLIHYFVSSCHAF